MTDDGFGDEKPDDDDDDDDEDEDDDEFDMAEFEDLIDDEDEHIHIRAFLRVAAIDAVLRGKRWTGEALVDVERLDDDDDEYPYFGFLRTVADECDDVEEYEHASAFLAEHDERLERWRSENATFARLSALLDGAYSYTLLEHVGDYRHVAVVYVRADGSPYTHVAELVEDARDRVGSLGVELDRLVRPGTEQQQPQRLRR